MRIAKLEKERVLTCMENVKELDKAIERIDEAEALYGEGRVYGALSKISSAFTLIALAYSKGKINKEEFREIINHISVLRNKIVEKRKLEEVLTIIDIVRGKIADIMFNNFAKCIID